MCSELLLMKKAKIQDFSQDDHNANKGTERGLRMLDDSISKLGLGRSILVDKHNRIIAGNKTQERAIDRGLEDAIVVETDGKQLVVVKRNDLDLSDSSPDNPDRQLAYADNAVAAHDLSWDSETILADIESGVDLSAWFDAKDIEAMLDSFAVDTIQGNEDSDSDYPLSSKDVPDALFPSDNDFGIPTLDLRLQADALDLPFMLWGAQKRPLQMNGTWGFYVYDYFFSALWADPTLVINTRPVNAVEPNFSTGADTPRIVALWSIYRKRWLARYWQSFGIRIFVDLNVHPEFYQDNLIGVPRGWKAYCTRGYEDRLDYIEQEYELACKHAESDSIIFVVYGGGKAVKQYAQKRNWIWLNETMTLRRERLNAKGQ